MIAATYTQGQGFEVRDLPKPTIADDELLVRVAASSICGTDLRIVQNGHRKLHDGQTIVLGHEFAGVIEECGGRIENYRVGQRIAVAPNVGCGCCEMCAKGLFNMCPDYTAFGITMDGAHAAYVRVPNATIAQGSVVHLPDTFSLENASLIEPLSCVVNGNRASQVGPGDTVVIYGAGAIGLLHLILAKHCGAVSVMVVDIESDRRRRAIELGASYAIDPLEEDVTRRVLDETHGRGADAVITACSVAAVQEEALGLLAPFGRVCIFGGLPKGRSVVRLDTNLIHYNQLVVTGVTGGSPSDFRTAMRLIVGGQVDVGKVVSHVFEAGEMGSAFEIAQSGQAMKIVLRHNEPADIEKSLRLDMGTGVVGVSHTMSDTAGHMQQKPQLGGKVSDN